MFYNVVIHLQTQLYVHIQDISFPFFVKNLYISEIQADHFLNLVLLLYLTLYNLIFHSFLIYQYYLIEEVL